MKIFTLLIIPFTVFALGETMSVLDSLYFKNAQNHPFRQKYNQEARMHQLYKIDEQQLKNIIKELTQEESKDIKLTTSGNYLIYKVSTQHHTLIINALDGTIIKKAAK